MILSSDDTVSLMDHREIIIIVWYMLFKQTLVKIAADY